MVEFLMAGASAVQVCTAVITKGPGIFGKLAQQLDRWLDKHGYDSVADIQGLALKQPVPAMTQPPILLPERCTGCNQCVISCVYGALYLVDKKIHIHEERCKVRSVHQPLPGGCVAPAGVRNGSPANTTAGRLKESRPA